MGCADGCKVVFFALSITFSVFFLIWMIISAAYYARDKRDEDVMVKTTCNVTSASDIRRSGGKNRSYYFYYVGEYYHEFLDTIDSYEFRSSGFRYRSSAEDARDRKLREVQFTCYYDKTKLGHLRTSKPNPKLWLILLLVPVCLLILAIGYFVSICVPFTRKYTSPFY